MSEKKEIYDFVKRLLKNEEFRNEYLSPISGDSVLNASSHANAAYNAVNTVVATNDLIVAGRDYLNQIDSFLDKTGNVVTTLQSYTWSQFTNTSFDTANTRRVIVTDVGGDTESHSLWEIVPTATTGNKRKLLSEPLYFATLNTAPYASQWNGLRIRAGNFGLGNGAILRSDGTYWRPESSRVCLIANSQNHVHNVSLTSFETAYNALLPVDANNNCILRVNDLFQIRSFVCTKTGTLDVFGAGVGIGANGNTSDTSLATYSSANTNILFDVWDNKWIRRSDSGGNSVLERIHTETFTATNGTSTGAKATPDTLTFNLDTNANQYIDMNYRIATSTGDSNVRAWFGEVEFIKGY